MGVAAVGDGFQAALGCLCGENVVVGIDESGAPFGGEMSVQLGLGLDNTLKAAKSFEVGAAHVGDKAEVGVGDAAERLNFARMVGTHLNDGNLCVGGDGKEREGHSEVVVEVAGGGVGAVAFGQYGVDKLLGGGLAVGARDAYHGDGELVAVVRGQLLQGQQHVLHHHAAGIVIVLGIGRDAEGCALFQRLRDESIAVEGLALEGEKDAAGGNLP